MSIGQFSIFQLHNVFITKVLRAYIMLIHFVCGYIFYCLVAFSWGFLPPPPPSLTLILSLSLCVCVSVCLSSLCFGETSGCSVIRVRRGIDAHQSTDRVVCHPMLQTTIKPLVNMCRVIIICILLLLPAMCFPLFYVLKKKEEKKEEIYIYISGVAMCQKVGGHTDT